MHHIGPIYTAPIHDKEFVQNLLQQLKTTKEEEKLGTHNRLLGVLTTVHEVIFNVVIRWNSRNNIWDTNFDEIMYWNLLFCTEWESLLYW